MDRHISLWDRLRSLRHGVSLTLSERTGRFRQPAFEPPAGSLDGLTFQRAARMRALSERYGVRFESRQDAAGALQAYEYLDFLDQALTSWGLPPPAGGIVQDIGCASFAYAPALVALLRPAQLIGVELEAYRRLRGGFNRAEKAAANIAGLPGVSFKVADYARFTAQADLITAFFPFVTPQPVLGWRMPLRVLNPAALFERIHANLAAGGALWMINHGALETGVAAQYAEKAGLRMMHRHDCRVTMRDRPAVPVVSAWSRQPAD